MTEELKEAPALAAAGVTVENLKELQQVLNGAPVPEISEPPPVEPSEPVTRELTEEEKAAEAEAKAQAVAEEHAAMWANLDGKSPFEWPDDARNLFQSGCTCSLWGRSVVDMSPDQRILFIAYIDAVASDLYGQCKGLAMAMEMRERAEAKAHPAETGEETLPGAGLNPPGEN